jgi:L-Lysine epsilon oxidase N-terminal
LKIKIHPAIGIARVGNSPNEFFIGPELVGNRSIPSGGYKDDMCRVKRQAARFRLFAYHNDGSVNEITSEQADITWTVHLANKKAAVPGRNLGDTKDLTINPGSRSLTGPEQRQIFDTSTIKFSAVSAVVVPLGEIRTDNKGRLVVLGGSGTSGSPLTPRPELKYFYYTAGWYDDTSDGPINATIKIRNTGESFEAERAWVIVAPPKFAPGIDNIITLYDRLIDMGVSRGWVHLTNAFNTSHIYPILERARSVKWVYDVASGITKIQ